MKIPKIISKNGHEYIFIQQNNNRTYLYKDLLYGYKETFTDFDLGMIKEVIPPPKNDLNVEKVKL